jgi:hypothetical protein
MREGASQSWRDQPVAGQSVRNRGLTQFLVRSMDKVKTIALWHALTHNMVCTWRLMPA